MVLTQAMKTYSSVETLKQLKSCIQMLILKGGKCSLNVKFMVAYKGF